MINKVLRDMFNQIVLLYLNDILIFSQSHDDHVNYARAILPHLLHKSLYIRNGNSTFPQFHSCGT